MTRFCLQVICFVIAAILIATALAKFAHWFPVLAQRAQDEGRTNMTPSKQMFDRMHATVIAVFTRIIAELNAQIQAAAKPADESASIGPSSPGTA